MQTIRQLRSGGESRLFQKTVSDDDLEYLYTRNDIAAHAVDIPSRHVFSKWFTLKTEEEAEGEENKALEDEVSRINKDLNVQGVFSKAYGYSRLYGLGIVIMGLKDSARIREEPENVTGIEYLVAYPRKGVEKIEFYSDPEDERYGEIRRYKVNIETSNGTIGRWVHADRVIHVMENTLNNSPWGLSKLLPVYDLFTVLKNLDWASGEAYFSRAAPILELIVDLEDEATPVPSKEEMDQMREDLKDVRASRQHIHAKGWELRVVEGSANLPNPQWFFDPVVERIAGGVEVPKQILLGTSAGALASGQVNMAQYFKDIASIQSNLIEPLLMEFYHRLQKWKILSEGDFDIVWNPLWEMSEKEDAEIWRNKALASKDLLSIFSREWIMANVFNLSPTEIERELKESRDRGEP
jgi:phage-related protein (TIGR01555 family)